MLEKICAVDPDDAEAWLMLGKVNIALGLPREGIISLRNAVTVQPDYFDAYNELGIAYERLNALAEAESCFRHATRLIPKNSFALANLGQVLEQLGKLGEAIHYYELATNNDLNDAYSPLKLASALMKQGRVSTALPLLEHALEINPAAMEAHSCLLGAMNYSSQDAEKVFHEHTLWNKRHAKRTPAASTRSSCQTGKRPLRVGYVSPDFCAHPVFFFIVNLLGKHDPSIVTTYCYSNVIHPDAITDQLRTLASNWREILKMSDTEVVNLIQEDRIDILVDLSGHTAHNRLHVFACKPAPIQISYLGYPNTTGLDVMDYRFTDARADPPGQTEHLHTETLFRLPNGFLNYHPLMGSPASPPVRPPPFQDKGHITFGSFNNLAKTNPEVIALWSRILHAVSDSRLILKNRPLSDPLTCKYIYQQFREYGIDQERIDLIGWIPNMGQHMSTYGKIDIALDTFPYNGTTTTCQALWMGVPVITLAGETHAGRVGVSLLSQMRLDEYITLGPDQYADCAINLANEPKTLITLRGELRGRMTDSFLCNGDAFARQIEDAYQMIWDDYCREHTQSSTDGEL